MTFLLDVGAPLESACFQRASSGGIRCYSITPLISACQVYQKDAVALLLARGANVNAVDSANHTPLIYAAASGDLEISWMLLDRGAVVDATTPFPAAPLMFCCQRLCFTGCREIASLLFQQGCSVQPRDVDYTSPLSLACASDYSSLAVALIRH